MTSGRSIARVHVVAVDGFGAEMAARLALLQPGGATVTSGGAKDLDRPAQEAGMMVVAAARPIAHLCDTLDDLSFERGNPWMPVVHEEGGVTLGPLVVPGWGPCYGCYGRRVAQHAVDADIAQILADFYRVESNAGPAGFFPPAAVLAAAMTAEIVVRLEDPQSREVGQVRKLNLLGWETGTGRVVGIHGCRRCGQGRDESLRTIEALSSWIVPVSGVEP